MSAIRAILLVGFVTLSSAFEYPSPPCKNITGIQNLNPEAYFKGTWYMTNSFPKERAFCMSIKTEITGKKAHQKYTLKSDNDTEYLDEFVDLESISNADGKFLSQMKMLQAGDRKPDPEFLTVNNIVIDTDYKNYAIVYTCTIFFKVSEQFYVLSRLPEPDQIHPNVEEALNKIGMKLKDFSSTKGLNCPKVS